MSRRHPAFLLASLAVLWAIAFFAYGLVLRATDPQGALVSENTLVAVAILAAPVIAAIALWLALHLRCRRDQVGATEFAWVVIAFCLVVSLIGIAMGGLYTLVMTGLMAAAAKRTPRGISSPA